jgi:hypothetical protein
VADGQLGEGLADLDLDQVLEVERLVEWRVAAHLDGGDDGARGAGQLRHLPVGGAGREQGQRQGRTPQGEPPQKRRSHCASTV